MFSDDHGHLSRHFNNFNRPAESFSTLDPPQRFFLYDSFFLLTNDAGDNTSFAHAPAD